MNQRLLAVFPVLLALSLAGCPKSEEKKDEKSKKGDDDDDDKGKKKKKKGDDDDKKGSGDLDPDAVCKHLEKLVEKEPDHKLAPRLSPAKCKKQLSKFKEKLSADDLEKCLTCLNDAEDLTSLDKSCEKACDKK